MKPHSFQPDPDEYHSDCDLCGETADAPIHEIDGVPPGDAEDDLPPNCPNCGREITEGCQIYSCEKCGKDCCTPCSRTTAAFPVICEECFEEQDEKDVEDADFIPPDDEPEYLGEYPPTVACLFGEYGIHQP